MTILKIAFRNLLRYSRRTLLTMSLISVGVVLVVVFGGIGKTFKTYGIGILTNSTLGDFQIHKKGYLNSLDNLPLNISFSDFELKQIDEILKQEKEIHAYSKRIRFGAMISNYNQSANIRLYAVDPEAESKTCQDLPKRIKRPDLDYSHFIKPGEILIPELLFKGLKLSIGQDIVIVATNKDGSMNGSTLKVGGISGDILGPTGKDGFIHIEDAKTLLRIESGDICEIAVKLKDFDNLDKVVSKIKPILNKIKNSEGNSDIAEIHIWNELSPFASISRIIDLLLITVRIILISIVLMSILNVMIMSVYERISEIGTIASIGTPPSKILYLFLCEGFLLGIFGAILGSSIGIAVLSFLKIIKVKFFLGRMNFVISPDIPTGEIIFVSIVVIIISVLASLQPAIKASKMEPVDALRHI